MPAPMDIDYPEDDFMVVDTLAMPWSASEAFVMVAHTPFTEPVWGKVVNKD